MLLSQLKARKFLVLMMLVLITLSGCKTTEEKRYDEMKESGKSPADIYVRLAEAYYQTGVLDVALEKSLKAVEVDDNYAPAHAMLALVYQRVGDNGAASEHFSKAMKLSPNDPSVVYSYGVYLCEQGQYQNADREFSKSANNPLNSTPWIPLTYAGFCFERAKQLQSARERFERALNLNPDYPRALEGAAQVERRLGNKTKARAYERKLRK